MKVEVLKDCFIQVKKGSVIEVDERQFELARKVLKPIKDEPKPKKKKTKEEE